MHSQYPIAIIGGTGKSGQYLVKQLIEQTDECHPILVSETDWPGTAISATSLAHFLIEQLSSETYVRKSPLIANG